MSLTKGGLDASRAARPGARVLTGLGTLFRLVPVLSWSVSDTFIGVSAAVAAGGWRPALLPDVLLVLVGATVFQGLVAHGVNDLEDWRTGTDLLSPGLLSGGSRVIPRRLLSERQIAWAVRGALIAGLACAAALYLRRGPAVVPVAAVGVWSAVAYTLPPLRLAYRPFIGELAAGWPAVVAIIVGADALLGGTAGAAVWAAAGVQATFSIAWVMQHHLPDVPADLRAAPPKLTTPAFFSRRWGPTAGRWVPAGYYVLGAAASAALALRLHPVFWGSAVLGALAAREALATEAASVVDVTRRQLRMIVLTALNAALLGGAFLGHLIPG